MPIVESYEIINSYKGLHIETTTNTYITLPTSSLVDLIKRFYDWINEQTNKYYSNWLYYINENDEAVILMLLYSTDYYDIKIPDYLGGKKVAYIADCAFSGCDQLQFVGLPNYLKTGGVTSRTFDNCPNLRWVYDRADCYMKSENIAYFFFDKDAKNNTSPYTAIGGVIYEKGAYSNENGNIETGLKLIYVPRSLYKRAWFEDSYAGIKIRYPSAYKTELRISNKVIDDKVESEESEEGKIYKVTAHGVEPGAMHNLKYVEVVYLPNGFPYFGEDGEEDLKEYYFKGCRDDLKVFNDSNYDLRIETGWIQFIFDFGITIGNYAFTKEQLKKINKTKDLIKADPDGFQVTDEVIARYNELNIKKLKEANKGLPLYIVDSDDRKIIKYLSEVDFEAEKAIGGSDILIGSAREIGKLKLNQDSLISIFINIRKIIGKYINQISGLLDGMSRFMFLWNIPMLKTGIAFFSDLILQFNNKLWSFILEGTLLNFITMRNIEILFRSFTFGGLIALLCDIACDGVVDGYLDISFKDGWRYKFNQRKENLERRKGSELSAGAQILLTFLGDSYYDSSFQDYLINL